MNVPGLRSAYDQVGGIHHFGRMLDKIRLHAAGQLPEDYRPNLGEGFDGGVCRFLGVKYDELVARVNQGGTDDEVLAWCFARGRVPTELEITLLNEYLRKRGWNDVASERLAERVKQLAPEWAGKIHTFFDLIEVDEGRPPRAKV
jgi:gluconokinase